MEQILWKDRNTLKMFKIGNSSQLRSKECFTKLGKQLKITYKYSVTRDLIQMKLTYCIQNWIILFHINKYFSVCLILPPQSNKKSRCNSWFYNFQRCTNVGMNVNKNYFEKWIYILLLAICILYFRNFRSFGVTKFVIPWGGGSKNRSMIMYTYLMQTSILGMIRYKFLFPFYLNANPQPYSPRHCGSVCSFL